MTDRKSIRITLSALCAGIAIAGCEWQTSWNQKPPAQTSQLQEQVAQLQEQVRQEQAAQNQWRAKHARASQQLASQRQQLSTLSRNQETERQQTETEISWRQAELDRIQKRYEETADLLNTAQTALRTNGDQKEVNVSQLQLALADTQEWLVQVQTERDHWKAKHAEDTAALESIRHELGAEMSVTLAERDHWQKQYDTLIQAMTEMTAQVDSRPKPAPDDDAQPRLTAELLTCQTTLSQAQHELAQALLAAQNSVAAPSDTPETLLAVQQQLSELKAKLQTPSPQLELPQVQTALREELALIKEELNRSPALPVTASEPHRQLENDLSQLRRAVNTITAERDEIQVRLTRLQLESDPSQLHHAVNTIRAERDEIQAHLTRQQIETHKLSLNYRQCQRQQAKTAGSDQLNKMN